jgi:FkbM family methyltransferase
MIKQDFNKWFSENGDTRYRIHSYKNFLKEDIYFDLGAYNGQFAKKFYNVHKCKIYCFEPVKQFYDKAATLLSNIDSAKCFNYGLGTKNEMLNICLKNDGSSFYSIENNKNIELVKMVAIDNFINKKNIKNIKLIKINIEGGEYDLLEYCAQKNLINKFENIQIQFHKFIEHSYERREKIRKTLSKTHKLSWDFPFIWESWERKNNNV